MMFGKNPTSTSKNAGTVVEWLMRFWSPGAYSSRWSGDKLAIIRQVTCRILEPSDTPGSSELVEFWRRDEIDDASVNIQEGLDRLTPGRLYVLELDVPADSMYRSRGPAGPKTGRAELSELPPWLNRNDVYDFQVRPARFWFEVQEILNSDPVAMSICVMHDDEENTSKRPAPARHQLRPGTNSVVNHVDVDWRPDWLRRGRRSGSVDIHPSGGYPMHGGKPTHVVLHSIGVPDSKPVSVIGAAINTFVSNHDKGGIHYIVDVDGHVVKMCPETRGLAHSNESSWRDKVGLNRRSVGIEHAWAAKPDVHPRAQIRATVDLVRAIKAEFGIDGRNIAGHGEVRCIGESEAALSTAIQTAPADRSAAERKLVEDLEADKTASLLAKNEKARSKNKPDEVKSESEITTAVAAYVRTKDLGFEYDHAWGLALHPNSRLVSCPGTNFDWAHFAKRSVVPQPASEALPKSAYAGLFEVDVELFFSVGDDDRTKTWGGRAWPDRTGSPVKELHDDIRSIGYAVPVGSHNADGQEYKEVLKHAIKAFKARYMQDVSTISRGYGNVDMKTATMIKRVVAAYARGPI